MYCIVLYCIVLYCIVLYYIVLYCIADEAGLLMLEDEAAACRQLSHNNIITLIDVALLNGVQWNVLPFYENGSLDRYLKNLDNVTSTSNIT